MSDQGKEQLFVGFKWLVQILTAVALAVGGYFFSKLDGSVTRLDQTMTDFRVQQAESAARHDAQIAALIARVSQLEAKCAALGR